ncbi:MAG: M48 family metallopeptidase [Clostridiales bacterium]|nr:M48 family metallopeptidase [Clostridiales bacterium]
MVNMVIKEQGIEIELVRKSVKNLSIRISREGKVTLTVPKKMPENEALKFFRQKISWVKSKIDIVNERLEFNFSDGERFFIFGKETVFKVVNSKENKVVFDIGKVTVFAENIPAVMRLFEGFIKQFFYECAEQYLKYWSTVTGFKYTDFKIKKTVSTWGSCNTAKGNISLSLYLVFLPVECLNYVALHEICHLKYSNHGEGFKNMLSFYMPKWKSVRKYMKENSRKFIVNI